MSMYLHFLHNIATLEYPHIIFTHVYTSLQHLEHGAGDGRPLVRGVPGVGHPLDVSALPVLLQPTPPHTRTSHLVIM